MARVPGRDAARKFESPHIAHVAMVAGSTLSFGDVELVLSALGNHSSHVGVQTSCLSALHFLVMNGSFEGV